MYHIAIMNKSYGLLPKILDGRKTIESRWYKNKSSPWGKIKEGDLIFFKNSSEQVTVKADIYMVLQFSNLTPLKIKKIIDKYGYNIGFNNLEQKLFFEKVKSKRYCILIFLKNSQKIKPFNINKSGFGSMSAWLCVDKVEQIRVNS